MTDPTADAKLLPCPFCGSKARIDAYKERHRDIVGSYEIRCSALDSRICAVHPSIQKADKAEVITAWNTRPQPAPPECEPDDVLINRVAKILCHYPSGPGNYNSCCMEPMGQKRCQVKAREVVNVLGLARQPGDGTKRQS